jgi:hypothetical protein
MAYGSAIEWTHSTYPFENCFNLTLRPERIDQAKHWRRPRLGAMLCWDRNGHSFTSTLGFAPERRSSSGLVSPFLAVLPKTGSPRAGSLYDFTFNYYQSIAALTQEDLVMSDVHPSLCVFPRDLPRKIALDPRPKMDAQLVLFGPSPMSATIRFFRLSRRPSAVFHTVW